MTGTLENIDSDEINENLLSTIRCPRNLGQITERLPKPQYMKRSNSMAVDLDRVKLEISKEENMQKLVKNQSRVGLQEVKIATHSKLGEKASRRKMNLASLPTIEEDCLDENTPERKRKDKRHLDIKQKAANHVRQSSRQHLQEI